MFRKTPGRRRLAGLAIGVVGLAGFIAMPVAMSTQSAQAAEPSTELVQTADLRCAYGSFGTNYTGTITTTVGDEGAVTVSMTDIPAFGMPSQLSFSQLRTKVTATVDGEDVTLNGVADYSPRRAANLAMPLANATGTRTGTGPISEVTISKIEVGMSVYTQFGPPPASGPTEATMNCLPAVHTTLALAASTAESEGATLTATLTPSTATGSVQFYEGATKLGAVVPLVDGVASKSLTGVSLGDHTYSATYVPTANTAFVPATSTPVTATVNDQVVQTADLRCAYGTFGTNYTGTITTKVIGDDSVTVSMTDIPAFGMPSQLSFSQLRTKVTATVDGEDVTLNGVADYSPRRAANLAMPLANATGTRTGTGPISEVTISKIEVGMSVYTQFGPPPASGPTEATMNCLPAVHTQLGLSVSTAQPEAASLTATLTPSTATGSVQFYEGATKLGAVVPLVEGVAGKELTGVSLGDHTYSATYVPTANTAFVPATSAPVTATVTETGTTETPTEDPSVTPTDDPSVTPTDDPTVTPTDEPSSTPTDEPPAALQFACAFGSSPFSYTTTASIAGSRDGGTINVGVSLGSMPNSAPVSLSDVTMVATLSASVNNIPVTLTGTNVQNMTPGTPITVPAMTGSVVSSLPDAAVSVLGFSLTAMGNPISCSLPAPVYVGFVPVGAGPTESPTESPTSSPTSSPTASPTSSPTASPTVDPTPDPACTRAKARVERLGQRVDALRDKLERLATDLADAETKAAKKLVREKIRATRSQLSSARADLSDARASVRSVC